MGTEWFLVKTTKKEKLELTRENWKQIFPYGGSGFYIASVAKDQKELSILISLLESNTPESCEHLSEGIMTWVGHDRVTLINDDAECVIGPNGDQIDLYLEIKTTGTLYA